MDPTSASPGRVGFRIAGTAHLHLVGASPAEVGAVAGQLGLDPGEPADAPDVVVRYHDDLEPSEPMRYVELGRFGWADERFWWLRGLGGRRVRIRLDPASLDLPLHLDCERRGTGIPLLTQLLGAVLATRGTVAVHAAAFRLREQNVLVTGWSESGKSESLLAASRRGARSIGDDTVYLDAATGLLRGLPVPVRVKAWYAAGTPELRRSLGRSARLRLTPAAWSAGVAGRRTRDPAESAVGHVARKLDELADRALTASAPLSAVAGPPLDQHGHRLDHVVMVVNSGDRGLRLRAADPDEVALRVQASLQDERDNLAAAYRQMRFAFPGTRWPVLDEVDAAESTALRSAFARARVWTLDHPHPVDLDRLADAVDEIVAGGP